MPPCFCTPACRFRRDMPTMFTNNNLIAFLVCRPRREGWSSSSFVTIKTMSVACKQRSFPCVQFKKGNLHYSFVGMCSPGTCAHPSPPSHPLLNPLPTPSQPSPTLPPLLQIKKGGLVKSIMFQWAYGRKLYYMKQGWRQDKV